MKRRTICSIILTALALVVLTACGNAPAYVKFNNINEVPRISIEEAKTVYDARDAIFVDSRAPGAYQGEHIRDSINIPEGEVDKRLDEIPRGKRLIIYCS